MRRHPVLTAAAVMLAACVPAATLLAGGLPGAPWHVSADPDPSGHWDGAIEIQGTKLGVQVFLVSGIAGWTGHISIPEQGAKNLPLEKVEIAGDGVSFRIANIPGAPTFRGKLDAGTIAGSFTQGGVEGTFTLRRAADPAKDSADALSGFAEWLESARAAWNVPGVSVAIVRADQVVFSGAAGMRDVDAKLPMTADTLLAIGSSTKAFTTAVLGTLADEGKVDWDAPVRTYLPSFAIADEDAARQLTITDLVTHRSGMPRHDLVWYNSDATRAELLGHMRYLPSNKGVRAEFQYNNLMYLAAGVVIEQVTSGTWEGAVKTRVLDRLGMSRSVFGPIDAQKDADCAAPYREDEDHLKRVPHRDIRVMGPAGSIYSSAGEMSRWVRAQLSGKAADASPLVSPGTLVKLHSVHMHIGGPGAPPEQQTVAAGYALGWFVDAYRGHRRLHHGGNIDGFSALVVLFPDDDMGMVILTNMDSASLPSLVARHAADRLLKLDPVDWNAKALAERATAKAQQKEAEAKKQSTRVQGTSPSHLLADLVGRYEHPGYGIVDISASGDALSLAFNRIGAPLQHWHYDVFSCAKNPDDPTLEDTKVQFLTAMDGSIDSLRVVFDPNFDPLVFTRLPDAVLKDPAHLARLAGGYLLGPQTVTFDVRGSALWATVPGQPSYELLPTRNNTFLLKGLSGFSVKFDVDEQGAPVRASFLQPNGVFAAERKR
jgi:CubicO group peptidase (beta-lactamase class C family)